MYFCQSGAEAKSESEYVDTVKSNYYSSCDQLSKFYTDLDESIQSINTILSNLQNGTTSLSNTRTTLNEMSTKLNCTTATGNILTICNQLKAAATGVGSNSTNIQNILTTTTGKMREVLTSQNTLSNSMGNLQCAGATFQKKEATGGNLGSGMVGSRTEDAIRLKGSATSSFGSDMLASSGSFGSGSGSR
jgi:ABC-type transporter Mla subunit MlaD